MSALIAILLVSLAVQLIWRRLAERRRRLQRRLVDAADCHADLPTLFYEDSGFVNLCGASSRAFGRMLAENQRLEKRNEYPVACSGVLYTLIHKRDCNTPMSLFEKLLPIYLFLVPLGAWAESDQVVDWPIPTPAQSKQLISTLRVIDIGTQSGLRGAGRGFLLPNGRILFSGGGKAIGNMAISLLDPASGEITPIWESSALYLKAFVIAPDKKVVWFATAHYGKPDAFYVIDTNSWHVFPFEKIYGEGLQMLEAATRDDGYWEIRGENDGRLLLEWSD